MKLFKSYEDTCDNSTFFHEEVDESLAKSFKFKIESNFQVNLSEGIPGIFQAISKQTNI